MKDELLTGAASAAKFTGMTRRQIYRLVEEGHLPCTRKGRRMFFLKSDLRRAFEQQKSLPSKKFRRLTIAGIAVRANVMIGSKAKRFVGAGGDIGFGPRWCENSR